MNFELDTILRQVAEDTFAAMAFILPLDDQEQSSAEDGARRMVAQVAFSGPFDGRLVLSIDRRMLPAMAANMLGLPDADSTPVGTQVDALGELLNVICGSLLPQITGPQELFRVRAPQVIEDGNAETDGDTPPEAQVRLRLESGSADLTLFTNHPLAIAAP